MRHIGFAHTAPTGEMSEAAPSPRVTLSRGLLRHRHISVHACDGVPAGSSAPRGRRRLPHPRRSSSMLAGNRECCGAASEFRSRNRSGGTRKNIRDAQPPLECRNETADSEHREKRCRLPGALCSTAARQTRRPSTGRSGMPLARSHAFPREIPRRPSTHPPKAHEIHASCPITAGHTAIRKGHGAPRP